MAYIKDFDNWNLEKKNIDIKGILEIDNISKDYIRKWEIRWCAIGVNIGSEIDGKGKEFLRPCLLLEESTPDIFLIIPMSTKIKKSFGYREIEFNSQKVSLCIHQIKTISKKRIYGRLSKLSEGKIKEIRKYVVNYFNLNK